VLNNGLKDYKFMSENLTPNNINNDNLEFNNQDNDYKNLITRLKEIKITIALLEKIIYK
jgi:hypothetical protein